MTFAPDGGVSVCGGFDPFGLGSISPECLEYIKVDASNHASVDQAIVEASLSGPLFELPAGELPAAFGVFYKEDKYQYAASPVASVFLPDGRQDIQGYNASDDIQGDDHNLDIWGEVLVPLLRDVAGASSLEAVLGYRSVGLCIGRQLRLVESGAALPADRSYPPARLLSAGDPRAERLRALPASTAG